MKTKIILIALAAILAAAVAVTALALFSHRKLRVGVILPLTGPDAAVGLGMRNSIRLAIDEVNARGGIQGRKVELVECDDASVPEKAAAAARRLVEDKRVVAALVAYDPQCADATREILDVAGLPRILAGVSNREVWQGSDSEFSLLPLGDAQLAQAAHYAWDILGTRTFAYVHDNTPLGKSMVNHLRGGLGPLMGKQVIGGDLKIKPGETDFSEAVGLIRAAAPQYLLYGGRPLEAGLLLNQLRAAGFTGWFQSATHYPSQEFIDIAKDNAEGVVAVFHGLPPEDFPAGKAFLDAYAAERFREPPSIYGIYAYAEAQALFGAMDKSFLTRPSIAGALKHEGFETALGPIRFNYFGSTYQSAVIYQVIKGHWTPVYATDKSNKLQPYPRK